MPDLNQEDFEIYDNGKRQAITLFENGAQPITVVLMLDRSGSMVGNFNLVRSAAEQFVAALLPGRQGADWQFRQPHPGGPARFHEQQARHDCHPPDRAAGSWADTALERGQRGDHRAPASGRPPRRARLYRRRRPSGRQQQRQLQGRRQERGARRRHGVCGQASPAGSGTAAAGAASAVRSGVSAEVSAARRGGLGPPVEMTKPDPGLPRIASRDGRRLLRADVRQQHRRDVHPHCGRAAPPVHARLHAGNVRRQGAQDRRAHPPSRLDRPRAEDLRREKGGLKRRHGHPSNAPPPSANISNSFPPIAGRRSPRSAPLSSTTCRRATKRESGGVRSRTAFRSRRIPRRTTASRSALPRWLRRRPIARST